MGCVYPPHTLHFNSHAHVERDKTATLNNIPAEHFNSHAHVERDTFFPSKTCVQEISTHTLTWSVTYGVCLSATHLAFQLTRSRGA